MYRLIQLEMPARCLVGGMSVARKRLRLRHKTYTTVHAVNFWPNSQTSILNRWLQQWRHLVNKLYRARLVASGTICLLFLHLVVWILILNVISISVVEYIYCWRIPTLCCIDQLCLAVKSSTRPVGGGGQSRLMPLPGFILVWPLTFSILIVFDTTGIYCSSYLQRLVEVFQIVLEKSRRTIFSWRISTSCDLDLWPPDL